MIVCGGLIGYGYWGPNVARQIYNNHKVKFKVICDKKLERLEKAKTLYMGQIKYEIDYEKILSDDEIDTVFIAVETSEHFHIAKDSLLAGKHVYVEKPFTSTSREAEELKNLAEKMNKKIHVDHIMVYHPCIRKIKEFIDKGELGDLLYIDAQRMNLGQIKKDVSAMWDLAVHDLSIIDYLSNSQEPEYISVVGECYYNPKETITFLSIKYPTFIAHIKSNWLSPLKERKLIVAGTKKMIVFDDMKISEKLIIYDKGVDIVPSDNLEYEQYAVKTRTGDVVIPYIPEEDSLYNSIDHFIECIINNKTSISGPDSAIRIIKILEEADRRMNR